MAAAVAGSRIRVTVEDSGPGIPPQWRAKVTQPFVRIEASRNRCTGGAWLGLAIGEATGGGACVGVDLPLFVPAP